MENNLKIVLICRGVDLYCFYDDDKSILPNISRRQSNIEIWLVNRTLSSVVVITAAQLHLTKPELRFCAGSNPAGGVSEIRDGEDL